MKRYEDQSVVDEYFRLHESNIAVVYNPGHWRRLAAALDAGPPSELPTRPRRITRRFWGKLWWISGFVITIVLTSDWVGSRQASSDPMLLAPSIPALSPMESTNEVNVEEQSTPSLDAGHVLKREKTLPVPDVMDAGADEVVDLKTAPALLHLTVPVGDSSQVIDTLNSSLQPLRADSTFLDTMQMKTKKKHLFW